MIGRLLKSCGCGCLALVVLLGAGGTAIYFWFQKTYNTPLPPAPKLGPAVALRPTIVPREGEVYEAGTAVAVRTAPGKAPILLTALHLFGPSGGLDRQYAPAELHGLVKELQLKPFGSKNVVARTQSALRRKGPTLVEDESRVQFDLAVFSLAPKPTPKMTVLPLAEKNPVMGEWVWLVGDEFSDQPQRQRLFAAQVGIVNLNGGLLRLKEPVELQGFSGGPVVNTKGEVVGILISGSEAGAIINTAEGIRNRLMESRIK
jgi:hypothetical protein